MVAVLSGGYDVIIRSASFQFLTTERTLSEIQLNIR